MNNLISSEKGTNVIFILGLHERGTSVTAGVLKLLGINMADDLTGGDRKEAITQSDSLANRVRRFCEDSVEGDSLIGIDNPNVYLSLPIWQQVLDAKGLNHAYIILLHYPLEISDTTHHHIGRSSEKCLPTWANNLVEIERVTRNYPRSYVYFNDLLVNPYQQLGKVAWDLSIKYPNDLDKTLLSIKEFLENTLQQAARVSPQSIHLLSVEDKAKLLLDKEIEITRYIHQINELQSEVSQLIDKLPDRDAEILAIKQSLSFRLGWALTAPLRFLYDQVLNNQAVRKIAGGPLQILRHLNRKNLKTLQYALKHESPRVIWKNFLQLLFQQDKGQTYDALKDVQLSKQQAIDRPQVLYISPHLPDFDASSGGKRATRLLGILARSCDVFVYTTGARNERHIGKLKDLGIDILPPVATALIPLIFNRLDTIIFSFYRSFVNHKQLRHSFPDTRFIIDSVDVHWVREQRSIGIEKAFNLKTVTKDKKIEVKAYAKADAVWAVTQEDKSAILAEAPAARVTVVSNIYEPYVQKYHSPGTYDMLFIGGFYHHPNTPSVLNIANEILPKVRAKIPQARLIIAGSHAPPAIIALGEREGIRYLGFTEEKYIPLLYEQCLLAICPLLSGAGIKGKICEAIVHRTPVVTNAIGNEGINLIHEEEGLIAESAEELATCIIKLMTNHYDLDAMTEKAQQKLATLVSPEIVGKNALKDIIFPNFKTLMPPSVTLTQALAAFQAGDRDFLFIKEVLLQTQYAHHYCEKLEISRVDSEEEYHAFRRKSVQQRHWRRAIEKQLWEENRGSFFLQGMDPIGGKMTQFHVFSEVGKRPQFHHNVIDESWKLTSEMRAMWVSLQYVMDVQGSGSEVPLFIGHKNAFSQLLEDYFPVFKHAQSNDLMELDEPSFDLIISLGQTSGSSDPSIHLEALFRLLKTNGQALISISAEHDTEPYDKISAPIEDMITKAKLAGFRQASVLFCWSWKYGILGEQAGIIWIKK